eukprot:gene15447-21532_t
MRKPSIHRNILLLIQTTNIASMANGSSNILEQECNEGSSFQRSPSNQYGNQYAHETGQQHYDAPTPRKQWVMPSPDSTAAAGGFVRKNEAAIPLLARGVYMGVAGRDHLTHAEGGLSAESSCTPTRYMPQGAARNNDAIHTGQTGITGGHNKKDGDAAFVGYYGAAHAGKAQRSVISIAPGMGLPEEDSGHRFRPQQGQQQYSGVAAALGSPTGGGGNAPLGHNYNIRVFPNAQQSRDNLTNAHAGLVGRDGTDVHRPSVGQSGEQSRARGSSIIATQQGLSSNGQGAAYNSGSKCIVGHPPSSLMNKPGGLIQGGEATPTYSPYAGKTNESSLKNGPGGMFQPGAGYQPMSNHAGKSTASSLMQRDNGITLLPKDAAGGSNARNVTNVADTYRDLQIGQAQVKQHVGAHVPNRF